MNSIWHYLSGKLQEMLSYQKTHANLFHVSVSVALVIAICSTLLVATPVSAVVLNLPDLPATVYTDVTYSFGAEITIESAEIIPITSFRLDINGATPAFATFSVNGTITSQSGAFTSITPVPTLAVAYGNYSASGLGNQSGTIGNYTVNTGFGYGNIVNPLGVPYRFNIQFNPNGFTPGAYTARLSAIVSNSEIKWVSSARNLEVLGATPAALHIATTLQYREENVELPNPRQAWITPMEVWLHAPTAAWTEDVGNGALYHYNTATNDTSIISLPVPPGTYDIRVKGITTLKNFIGNVAVAAPGPVNVNAGTLIEGDANGDNMAEISDYSLIVAYFGTEVSASLDSRMRDFNNDGYTDISEYSIIVTNFGQGGADIQ